MSQSSSFTRVRGSADLRTSAFSNSRKLSKSSSRSHPIHMAQTILTTPVMGQVIRKTPIEEALCRLTTRPLRQLESEGPLVYWNGQGDTLAVPIA